MFEFCENRSVPIAISRIGIRKLSSRLTERNNMKPISVIGIITFSTLAAVRASSECVPQPDDYVINDPISFGITIAKAVPPRDQFDSDVQYQAKLGQAYRQLTSGLGPSFHGIVAITVDRSQTVTFYPGKGILAVPGIANERYALSSIEPDAARGKGYHGGFLANTKEDGGTYASTNGFGAPVQVHKIIVHNLGIAWDNKRFKISNNGTLGSPHYEVIKGLTGDQARTLSAGLKAGVRGRPTFPYFFMETISGNPTFNNPLDVSQENTWLFIEPVTVCIGDAQGRTITEWDIVPR